MRLGRLRNWILAAAAVTLLAVVTAPAALAQTVPLRSLRADSVALTVTGKDGTVKTYTMADIRAMTDPAQGYFAGYAGFLNSASNLTPMHPVRGITLASVLAAVGYDNATDVTVYASDNYGKLLSPQWVQGAGIPTYTDAAGYATVDLPSGMAYTPILGYDYKQPGQTVSDANPWVPEGEAPMGEGPLRLWWALPTQPVPGFVPDGDMVVKWVDRVTVTGTLVKQWTVAVTGPKKTYALTRKDFESCVAASCHGEKKVRWNGHTYSGLPFYYIAGKVDDNTDMNNFGSFNTKLAKKGYTIQVRSKTKTASFSSKLLAGRPQNIILAWKRDGQYLTDKFAPLWLVGGKLTAKQRVAALQSIRLRGLK